MHILDRRIWFPPSEDADSDGLLAMGGDLSVERILYAYQHGIFPWYSGEIPLWWSPDPRFVLFPEKLHIGKHLKRELRKNNFDITTNKAFKTVINHCSSTPRPGQDGTWLNNTMKKAYIQLHALGYAQSFEAWKDGNLAGGLYGVKLGNVFFGESMFSHEEFASKVAFVHAVEMMKEDGLSLVDCQVYTPFLESFGAALISRHIFLEKLKEGLSNVHATPQIPGGDINSR